MGPKLYSGKNEKNRGLSKSGGKKEIRLTVGIMEKTVLQIGRRWGRECGGVPCLYQSIWERGFPGTAHCEKDLGEEVKL